MEEEKERDKKRRFWDLRQSKKERELRERERVAGIKVERN